MNAFKNYYALLFPTCYKGEGIVGTLLDVMVVGVQVIASDGKYNKEFVNERNGVLFETSGNTKITIKR
ncbi:hypothetical protein [Mediterraneibacter gnavus]|uniref:hypothetical protein n=1 Tax=Mediterraneibacter gnavus TaxID=33038 RepID=UPI002330147B|nr:hypothetical protein [Mediterraneibacter gnavus]MDB8680477.1 hypothetical protein [Mediterraneibacter gnavus]MDB8691606.1 hypothetical protein [Mediterraneibacter gnavus]